MRKLQWCVAGVVTAILAGCGGAEEIASPGSGGNVTISNPPAVPPTQPDTDPGADPVTPAAQCPAIANPVGLTDAGTITGPTGTYRVCTLPSPFTASTTLERVPGLLYALNGRVDVGPDRGAAP